MGGAAGVPAVCPLVITTAENQTMANTTTPALDRFDLSVIGHPRTLAPDYRTLEPDPLTFGPDHRTLAPSPPRTACDYTHPHRARQCELFPPDLFGDRI